MQVHNICAMKITGFLTSTQIIIPQSLWLGALCLDLAHDHLWKPPWHAQPWVSLRPAHALHLLPEQQAETGLQPHR